MSEQLVRVLENPYYDSLSLADKICRGTIPVKNPGIRKVIYNDPATIILWVDGTKTVVRCQPGDVYDKKTGFLLCIAKRFFGNLGRYNNVIKEWSDEEA